MVRRVFYSFHYAADAWRASQIRNIGVIEGNKPASDNDWETVRRGGDRAIQKWIDQQLDGRSCTIVLIGKDTTHRDWINYEIETSWNNGKGVVGIHIHNLKDSQGRQSTKGINPFVFFTIGEKGNQPSQKQASGIVKTYDPPYSDSLSVYSYISENLSRWIEEAIFIRNNYDPWLKTRAYNKIRQPYNLI